MTPKVCEGGGGAGGEARSRVETECVLLYMCCWGRGGFLLCVFPVVAVAVVVAVDVVVAVARFSYFEVVVME